MRDLGHRMNAVNNDVQVLHSRYEQAIELLRLWAEAHPEDQALAGHTTNTLNFWRTQDLSGEPT